MKKQMNNSLMNVLTMLSLTCIIVLLIMILLKSSNQSQSRSRPMIHYIFKDQSEIRSAECLSMNKNYPLPIEEFES